jgi:signal transduction histidine kinase
VYLILFKKVNWRFLAIVAWVSLVTASQAQTNKRIDSLVSTLKKASGRDRFNSLYEIAFQYATEAAYDKALPSISEAQEIAMQMGDSLRMVKSGRLKGQILRRMDRTFDAIQEFRAVLPIARNQQYDAEYGDILNALAVTYTYQANYDKALETHFESLILREKIGDNDEIGIALNNIGLVYYKLNNLEKALDYYKRSLKLTDRPKYKLPWLINTGLCFNALGDYVNAKKSIDEGFSICEPNCDDFIRMQGEFGLGAAAMGLKKPQDAFDHFEASYALSKKQNDTRFQIENLLYISQIRGLRGEKEEAKRILHETEALAEKTEYNQLLISIYKQFSILYSESKDFENAAAYQHKYILLKDSIFSENLIKNLAHVQTAFEERENLKTIKNQDAVLALKEETLKRQRAENVFYAFAAVLVFGLAILMLLLFRLTRRANERLEERVEARTKDLNDSNDALSKVNGEMDNFIYKTSHDIRGPLASLKGICNVAIMDVHDTTALGYLKKLDSTADKLNMILTRLLIINQINHAVLAPNMVNFEEIIEEILLLEHKKGIPKRLNITYAVDKGFVMKSDKEMIRIVLENLIDNGIKFYNESERIDPFVRIHVGSIAERIVITVTDNGVGINEETKEKIFHMFVRASERSETGGIGLYLAKLATERLSGDIDFRTTPERLTEFTVTLPLDLGPVLERRREQDRIREFETSQPKPKPVSSS